MPRPSFEWIDSAKCPWPRMVKELAKQIIRERAALAALHDRFVKVDMLDPEKVLLTEQLAQAQIKLANLYRNLGKELAYHRSITND